MKIFERKKGVNKVAEVDYSKLSVKDQGVEGYSSMKKEAIR